MSTATDTTPLQTAAADALRYFITLERADGTHYVRLTDNAPEWLTVTAYNAHGGELPNDWRWLTIHSVFKAIARGDITDDDGAHEFADATTDLYTAKLLNWLSEDMGRIEYIEEARGSFGTASFSDELVRAQYYAIRDTVDTILNALRDQLL